MIHNKQLSERDSSTKFITPAIEKSGRNKSPQILEELYFTIGKIHVRGKLTVSGETKRAGYNIYFKPIILIAIMRQKTIIIK